MPTFKASLAMIGINPFVFIPQDILYCLFDAAGRDKGPISVRGMINGAPYVQTLLRYKGEWRLYINTSMLPNSPKRIGEVIEVSIEFDERERTLKPHPDLLKALEQNHEAEAIFDALSPSRQKEIIRYISALKTEESRDRNIIRAVGFLLGQTALLAATSHERRSRIRFIAQKTPPNLLPVAGVYLLV